MQQPKGEEILFESRRKVATKGRTYKRSKKAEGGVC